MSEVQEIIDTISELHEDNSVPRNVKLKLQNISEILQEEEEISIRVNKALDVLDEIGDDINMEAFTRSQIWNIASMLETCK